MCGYSNLCGYSESFDETKFVSTQIFVSIQKCWYLNICGYSKVWVFLMWLLKVVGTLKKFWDCKLVGLQNSKIAKFEIRLR